MTGLRRRVRLLLQPARSQTGRLVSRLVNAAGASPIGLKVGGDPATARHDQRPVVLVLLFGAAEPAVAETVTALAALAGDPACGRPLLVLDRPWFAVPRRAGCAVEHLVSADDWQRQGEPGSWPGYLRTRLDQLRVDYLADHVLTLPPAGALAVPPELLRAGLRADRPTGLGALRQGCAGAVERLLDR